MNLLIGIILSFTFLLVGFLLGNVFPVNALRADDGPDEMEANAEETEAEATGEDGESGSASPTPAPALDAPPRLGLRKYVRFWREEGTKKLVTQVEDDLIDYGADLNEDQRGRLSLLLIDLQDWIGLESQLKAAEEREAAKRIAPPADNPEVAASEPQEQNARGGLRINPIEMFRKGMEADIKLPAENKLVSIAAQIDEILQDNLSGSPLEDRGIELEDIPGKGMVVHVGTETYEGVGEVPDAEIQQVIRKAVLEWENRVSQI